MYVNIRIRSNICISSDIVANKIVKYNPWNPLPSLVALTSCDFNSADCFHPLPMENFVRVSGELIHWVIPILISEATTNNSFYPKQLIQEKKTAGGCSTLPHRGKGCGLDWSWPTVGSCSCRHRKVCSVQAFILFHSLWIWFPKKYDGNSPFAMASHMSKNPEVIHKNTLTGFSRMEPQEPLNPYRPWTLLCWSHHEGAQ